MNNKRLVQKERCETCHGMGMIGELFADETIPFAHGLQCPDCDGKGYRLINRIGICPDCDRPMVHYRLRGYVCSYCQDKD